jgi:hypothetical protein
MEVRIVMKNQRAIIRAPTERDERFSQGRGMLSPEMDVEAGVAGEIRGREDGAIDGRAGGKVDCAGPAGMSF